MKKSIILLFISLLLSPLCIKAHQPEFSTAGFFRLADSGREVYSMNPAWRFYKGNCVGAEAVNFNDRSWEVVSLPHGIEYLPTEASGCVNYQGEVWYRKHFTPDATLKGKKLFLHFEAIMGKSKIYVNGKLLSEHFGGYLPAVVDVTDALEFGKDNLIAVWADNSNDPNYPPGKQQEVLDFTYFGGIYRDCWLVAHNQIFITDPNYENEEAGGGLFVAYDNVSDLSAEVLLKIQIRNSGKKAFKGVVEYELQQPDGQQIAFLNSVIRVKSGKAASSSDKLTVKNPMLWSPETPTLYNLIVRVRDEQGNVIDGYRRRIGIRSIEFKGEAGFWLNGRPYETPLIGANRHQDFAIVGNAVPNSIHWRDAKKLRDAGMKVIRNAHCPQDPAFMDACDELGLFVIVNTPGWQFWNDAPVFAQRVYSDIRNMVRRDRNHPCVWMWEPILNETWYPADFAQNAHDIVKAEYPYPYCYSGCDSEAKGKEHFQILFTHPLNGGGGAYSTNHIKKQITYFTREWGDNVDDWNSHNSPSRVARNWGEQAMLIQAQHYACPPYKYTSYDALYRTPEKEGMPYPIITFKDAYDFMQDKALSRQGKQADVYLLAEGLIDGKVVATHKVYPARRPEKLLLWIDNEGVDLKADGSDFITVIAAVADKNGNIKRLNNYTIKFQVEGEGRILGGANNLANPASVRWGTAPVLIQSTLKPGKIKITASVLFEGSQMPSSAVLELESKPGTFPQIYSQEESAFIPTFTGQGTNSLTLKSETQLEKERLQKAKNAEKLKEVEQQQEEFGEKK